MPRSYGTTNAAPYASAPAVGAAGDTYYNTTDKCLYQSDGTTWTKVDTWSVSGTTLTPTDTTKTVVIPTSAATSLQWGPTAIKHYLVDSGASLQLQTNYGTAINDTSKPQWALALSAPSDVFALYRSPAGTTATFAMKLTLDSTGVLTVPGSTGSGHALTVGNQIIKARVFAHPTLSGYAYFTNNAGLNASASAWLQDDTSKSSWIVNPTAASDQFLIQRAPPAGVPASVFWIDANANLTIAGSVGQKASGTTWSNPSDRRLKDDITNYATGLAAILALEPRTFLYNGKGGSQAGLRGYGFLADEVAPVMPEMVGTIRVKLNVEDEAETEIQTLDTSNLVLALVNAVKELAARVAALETARA